MRIRARIAAYLFFVAGLSAVPAIAQVKLAFIDPLSGGAASAGINAQKHFTYEIDKINAAGGLNGEGFSENADNRRLEMQIRFVF